MQKYIRFVGGPWHNRVECVHLTPNVTVPVKVPCGVTVLVKHEVYSLGTFQTKHGTTYYQYIHASLIRGGNVSKKTYRERFPKWEINRQQLTRRLRRAMKWQAIN